MPGQFDFSQQSRTFRLELLRSVPQGVLGTALMTFAVIESMGPASVAWMSAALMLFSTVMILPEMLKEWRSGERF